LQKIKRLAGETVLYGLGNIVPRLLNFILFPIHTAIFNPEEYGVFTWLMSIVAMLNIVYSFGMETAYFRFATKPGADEKKIFNIAQTAVVIISAFLSIIFITNASFLSSVLKIETHRNYIIWLALILFIDNIVSIPFARLRLEKKAVLFSVYRISNVVILTGLNLYFLYVIYDPQIGIGYIFIANLIANAFYLIFFFKTFIQWRPSFDKEIFPTMTRYAYPIMLMGLAAMTNEFFSRLALEKWLPRNFYPGKSSEYALGVFGACYKFSVFMNLTVQAFRMAAEPFFFSQATDKNSPSLFAKINHYFIIVGCFIMLAISINIDVLKFLFLRQEKYWEGIEIIPPLLLGYLFLGVYYNFSVWFKLTDKTYFGTLITIGGAILTIALNYLLIPIAGYLGSSWATALVYGFMAVACYIIGQKYFPIPYDVTAGLAYIFITYVLIYVVNALSFSNQWAATGFHGGILILYSMMIFFLEKKQWRQPLA
jgi:O-antigen/teichoic acid export membrane protein